MATVYSFLPTPKEFDLILQTRDDWADLIRRTRFKAVRTLQRMSRGYLIRKHVAWLSYNAIVIQCAWRKHCAKKAFRAALKRKVWLMHHQFYAKHATRIQALWRGYRSRKLKFDFYAYRRWLRTVTERGERKAAEAAEFTIRSRVDDLKILEDEARQWLAFVAFKLHHLLRTYSVSGVYSDIGTTELSHFERLLVAIKYTEYMKRLRRKYGEFVMKHKPKFSNKKLFPIIGDGHEYWYLTLPEMYKITIPKPCGEERARQRHSDTHHGKIHTAPFLWRQVRPPTQVEGRGPFKIVQKPSSKVMIPPAPAPTPSRAGDSEPQRDPRFNLYVKYYRPQPDVMDYINYHINCVLRRKVSIQNVVLPKEPDVMCRPKKFSS